MNHKAFEQIVDGLDDMGKFNMCRLMLDENMRIRRQQIWDANYKKLSKTKEWKEKMAERDALLDLGMSITVEQAVRLKELDEWIDDVMVPEYFDLLVKTFNEAKG